MGKENMKVTLAICTNRGIKPKTAQSLLEMAVHSKVEWNILVAERGYTIAENRNYCVVQAKKNESDYLFFIDDDMVFPKETFERLLGHNKEVIGVNSYSRCFPPSSTVGLMDKEGKYKHPDKHSAWEMKIPDGLFEAYFVGTGIMLIDMEIFKKIKEPYFAFSYQKNGLVKSGEDGSFCEKVKKSGMSIWCDGSLPVFHIGEYLYGNPKEDLIKIEKL